MQLVACGIFMELLDAVLPWRVYITTVNLYQPVQLLPLEH